MHAHFLVIATDRRRNVIGCEIRACTRADGASASQLIIIAVTLTEQYIS
jgi:hypothetical protein